MSGRALHKLKPWLDCISPDISPLDSWWQTREALWGRQDPSYSEYTCYSGISDFTPPDIDTVGYRVFLGNGKYFVTSDVGGGKMQWYGFYREPAGVRLLRPKLNACRAVALSVCSVSHIP